MKHLQQKIMLDNHLIVVKLEEDDSGWYLEHSFEHDLALDFLRRKTTLPIPNHDYHEKWWSEMGSEHSPFGSAWSFDK